jgi:hypothetical protein
MVLDDQIIYCDKDALLNQVVSCDENWINLDAMT